MLRLYCCEYTSAAVDFFAFYGQEQHVWSFPGCKIIRRAALGLELSCWGPGWPGYLGGAEFTGM